MGLVKGELSSRELITKIIQEKEGTNVTFLDMINTSRKYKTSLTSNVIEYFMQDAIIDKRNRQRSNSKKIEN